MNAPTLDQILNVPVVIDFGGRSFAFSEFTLDSLARLQAWIRENVPNPLKAVGPMLEGLDPGDRKYILDKAYQDAKAWPPAIGTRAAAEVLLGNKAAQVATFLIALRQNQPDATLEDAEMVYRVAAARQDVANRILAVMFAAGDDASPGAGAAGPKA